jgi:hypothetical protein
MTTNPVFRSIESRWRGPLPCAWSELCAGVVVALVVSVLWAAMFGLLAGLTVTTLLRGARAMDHDRSDYLLAVLRRLVRVRAYNASEPDRAFIAFSPR